MKDYDIVIPCKRFTSGKSRLAPALSDRARENLCRHLFARTLTIAIDTRGAGNVAVVSADDDVLALAADHGVHAFREPGHGLNPAISAANQRLYREKGETRGLMVLPIDLPLVSEDALAAAAERTGRIGIAPDIAETGTNLLLLDAAMRRDFGFQFGVGSFDLHRQAASARNVNATIIRDRRLAFDLDQPGDWKTLLLDPAFSAEKVLNAQMS